MKKTILILTVFVFALFSQLQAENDTNYTLDDLSNRLQSGTAGTLKEYTEPESGPGTPVGMSINEIMDMMPEIHDSAAERGSVLEGEYFWSLDGEEWGQNAGTMPNIGQQSITPGTSDQAISEGYHDGTGTVAGDADLVEENIKSGAEIFGVSGTAPIPSGDATADKVLSGSTFSNATETGVAGTMANVGADTITPSTADQLISQGYHDGEGIVKGDINLDSSNIKSGVSIFGVAGKSTVVETETDSGAVAGDILVGKKAWVNGEEVTGTVPAGGNITGNNGELEIAIPDGLYSGGDKTATAVDPNLISDNIKSGVSIFGVSGNPAVVNTSSGTATSNDMVAGEKAWVNGNEVTGTLPFHRSWEWIIANDHKYLIDPDGNTYKTVTIGTQVWTVENLGTTKYADGTAIPYVTDNGEWEGLSTPAYCYYNNTTDADSIAFWGALYNWYVVDPENPHDIAPEGWRVPTDEDWNTLQTYLINNGYNYDGTTTGNKIGKPLAATTDWISSIYEGRVGNDLPSNNSTGFSALPGGYRNTYGNFISHSTYGYWWSATEFAAASLACIRYLYYDHQNLFRSNFYKEYGFSVRLVRDLD